jgi:hypothetical protein
LRHYASPGFWKLFHLLPLDTQRLARDNFRLLKANPRHPSLRFKKVGPYWSVRVGRGYRALGTPLNGDILWGWIGSHADYDKLLK